MHDIRIAPHCPNVTVLCSGGQKRKTANEMNMKALPPLELAAVEEDRPLTLLLHTST